MLHHGPEDTDTALRSAYRLAGDEDPTSDRYGGGRAVLALGRVAGTLPPQPADKTQEW